MSGNGTQRRVLVTGGAGYVGSRLVPKLVDAGHNVTVLDLYLFGDVFSEIADRPGLRQVRGDIRDAARLNEAIHDCDAVIHLACISNDPSFELDPVLGKSINLDAFQPLVRAAKDAGVRRFISASSSSVYGVRDEVEVTEDLPLRPLTEYSKYKAECEDILDAEREPGFVTVILRPATVCGYARRLRLDLTVNILTNHAINNGRIRVFGGSQKRPNINIEDMTDLYVRCLDYSDQQIDGGVFNAGYENRTVLDLAEVVRGVLGEDIEIVTEPTDDLRSYHVSSAKLARELGFVPTHSVADAVESLAAAFAAGKVPNPMTDSAYYNIKTMQSAGLG